MPAYRKFQRDPPPICGEPPWTRTLNPLIKSQLPHRESLSTKAELLSSFISSRRQGLSVRTIEFYEELLLKAPIGLSVNSHDIQNLTAWLVPMVASMAILEH